MFRTLRELRQRVQNAATFPAEAEAEATRLERLLGGRPAGLRRETAWIDIAALIKRIVAPCVTPAHEPQQQAFIAVVDALIGEARRAVRNHPAFRALEAAWGGVRWLVTRLEIGEALQLYLLDARKQELMSEMAAVDGDLAASGLYRRLVDQEGGAPGSERWSLLAGRSRVRR